MKINSEEIIDPIQIENRFANYSTYENDVIFHEESINSPIFCGGTIKSINQNVFNLKINENVGYISSNQSPEIILSTNQIVRIPPSHNEKLIAILPYASYAMKILRHVNPKLNQDIALDKLNFFSTLLERLIQLSGSKAFLIDPKVNSSTKIYNMTDIDTLIYHSLYPQAKDFVSKSEFKHKFDLNSISIFDKGLDDDNYLKGIKYPYSFVRWDFKRNLEYFIDLVSNKTLLLDFFDLQVVEVDQLEEIKQNVNDLRENSLYLFKKSK